MSACFFVFCLNKKSLFHHLKNFALRKHSFAYCVEWRTWRTNDPAVFNMQPSVTPWLQGQLWEGEGDNRCQCVMMSLLFLYHVEEEYEWRLANLFFRHWNVRGTREPCSFFLAVSCKSVSRVITLRKPSECWGLASFGTGKKEGSWRPDLCRWHTSGCLCECGFAGAGDGGKSVPGSAGVWFPAQLAVLVAQEV